MLVTSDPRAPVGIFNRLRLLCSAQGKIYDLPQALVLSGQSILESLHFVFSKIEQFVVKALVFVVVLFCFFLFF